MPGSLLWECNYSGSLHSGSLQNLGLPISDPGEHMEFTLGVYAGSLHFGSLQNLGLPILDLGEHMPGSLLWECTLAVYTLGPGMQKRKHLQ